MSNETEDLIRKAIEADIQRNQWGEWELKHVFYLPMVPEEIRDRWKWTTLCIFFKGHLDDPEPREIKGKVIMDILNPPWKHVPYGWPHSDYPWSVEEIDYGKKNTGSKS